MKNIILFILTMLLFCNGSCENKSGSTSESSGPFLSREAIFQDLEKEHGEIDENDVCIIPVEEIESLFVAGFFAHDRGCSVNRIYYNGYKLKGDHSESGKIMQSIDFDSRPEELVEIYHIKVVNTFKTVVWKSNEDFEGVEFQAPYTEIEGDQIISRLWVQRPSGMIKERSYYLSSLTFDKAGNFVSLNKSKQFSVAY